MTGTAARGAHEAQAIRAVVRAVLPADHSHVKTHGWIEIGEDEYSRSFVRALNAGGMVWEGQEQSEYATMDDVLRALEEGLAVWMREQWGDHES